MTTPMKPWESGGSNLRSDKNISSLSIQSSSRVPDVNMRTVPAVPPPLPPRPSNVCLRRPVNTPIGGVPQVYRSYPTTGNYMGSYNSYGGYGTYGNYGLYNGMGYGASQYPGYMYNYQNTNDPNNRLIALAEETSRPAFESVESFVRAFGSISFMLESTLSALHASFRAALGVADHLGQLRNVLSAVSIFRFLQWIVRRVRMFFGGKVEEGSLGNCWGEAVTATEPAPGGAKSSPIPSHWLLGAFFGFVMSGSYLAWRLLSHIIGSSAAGQLSPFKDEENELWVQGRDANCNLAIACHDFLATSDQELSFRAGERLIIAPRSRQPYDVKDWLLAAHPWSPKHGGHPKIGLIPENYVRILERRNIRIQGSNPLVNSQPVYVPTNAPYSMATTYPQTQPQASMSNFQNSQPVNLPTELPINVDSNSNAINKGPSTVPQMTAATQQTEVKTECQAPVISENKMEGNDIVGRSPNSSTKDDSDLKSEAVP